MIVGVWVLGDSAMTMAPHGGSVEAMGAVGVGHGGLSAPRLATHGRREGSAHSVDRAATGWGTCGPALRGVELRLDTDGEILIRSPWLMTGYRNRPDATAEAIDPQGWLHTGDVGEFDDGHLRIIDRKKEIIINAGGKNMSPAHIEARIKETDPLIGDVCVIGNDRPYNVALIVADLIASAEFSGDVGTAIASAVERANARLARVEQIKRFHIVESPWLRGGDEVTPTMKLKRKAIDLKYAATIDALYADKE